ncbi:MAG: MmcQ/YjbR family DNA-binding protein [Bryobacteraceae bacterium]
MTAEDFRRLALSFPDAVESAHMRHPDFRVHGKIFATLHYPDESWGMVKLSPEDQQTLVHAQPEAFVPVKGAWGLQGCTSVRLEAADESTLTQALGIAWRKAGAGRPKKQPPKKASVRRTRKSR